jgi:hypothetical protein
MRNARAMRCVNAGTVASRATVVVLAVVYAGAPSRGESFHASEFDEAACISANVSLYDPRATGSAGAPAYVGAVSLSGFH